MFITIHTQHKYMTKAKPFRDVLGSLQRLLTEKAEGNETDFATLRDFEVMDSLGFSPQAWARWRPKLVEACQVKEVRDEGYFSPGQFTFEIQRGKIKYIKKHKVWNYEKLPLRKKLLDSEEWIELTEEELTKTQCEQ